MDNRRGGRQRMVCAVLVAAVAVFGLVTPAMSAGAQEVGPTVNVPADVPTIQAGIDAAALGGTVLVAPGTYREAIDFKGKAVEVRSSAGPATTVIDGHGPRPVVTFSNNEGRGSVLRGFTIRNGDPEGGHYTAGVFIFEASATVADNVMTGNPSRDAMIRDHRGDGALITGNTIRDNGGPGIEVSSWKTEVSGNVVEGNYGTGIRTGGESHVIRDNIVRGNAGGGMDIHGGGAGAIVMGNLVVENAGGYAAVMVNGPVSYVGNTLVNNTIVGVGVPAIRNSGPGGFARFANNVVGATGGGPALQCGTFDSDRFPPGPMSHNFIFNGTDSPTHGCVPAPVGTDGNVAADPQLVDPGSGDYRLSGLSPAVDSGTNADVTLAATDLDGGPRVRDGDGNGSAVVDAGAYETPIGPGVMVRPSPVDFGELAAGAGGRVDVRVQSSGRVAAHVSSVSVSGAGFSLSSNSCTGATLAPTQSCVLSVTLAPPRPGVHEGSLRVTHDGRAGFSAIRLAGEGLPPPPSLHTRFVTQAYKDIVLRDPQGFERDFWVGHLDAGMSRNVVSFWSVGTMEYRRLMVTIMCLTYLERQPDPVLRDALADLVGMGWSYDLVAALLLASDEYFEHTLRNNYAFVDSLFLKALGHPAAYGDPVIAHWAGRIDAGESRFSVAYAFLQKREAHERTVKVLYNQLLRREASAAELRLWADQLDRGLSQHYVMAFLIGSDEYLRRL
jgi:hypothetical protein